LTQTHTTPHYHESKPSKNQARKKPSTALGWQSFHPWQSSLGEGLGNRLALLKPAECGELTLVNVGQDTTLCDCDVSEKLVQFLIVADGELEMTGDDTGLFIVTGGVTSQLENFGREVFEDSSEVNRSTCKTRY
jgi:hypothetical protein